MTAREFARRFPNASQATIAANCEVHPAKSVEPAKALDRSKTRETESVERPFVRFTRCGKRLLDADNLAASFKNLQDGLRYSHLIVDDSPKYIETSYEQRKTLPNEEPHTLIEIYYA